MPFRLFQLLGALNASLFLLISAFLALRAPAGLPFIEGWPGPLRLTALTGLSYLVILTAATLYLIFLESTEDGRPWLYLVTWFFIGMPFLVNEPLIAPAIPLAGFLYWWVGGQFAGTRDTAIMNWLGHFYAAPGSALARLACLSVLQKTGLVLALLLGGRLAILTVNNFGLIAWLSVFPPDPGTPPYGVRFERDMTIWAKRSLLRFPDADSCAVPQDRPVSQGKPARLNWEKLTGTSDFQICAFRLMTMFGPIADADRWLALQGLKTSGPGFNSDHPYEAPNGTLRVDSGWNIRDNRPFLPRDGLRPHLTLSYLVSAHFGFSADGKTLLWVTMSGAAE